MLSCYFTAANHALLDYSRMRLSELLDRRGRAERAARLGEILDSLLLLTALSRTTCNLIMLAAFIQFFAPVGQTHTWGQLAAALLVTGTVIAVFGVAIPVAWAKHAAEPLLAWSLPLLQGLLVVMRPVMIALHVFDPLMRRLLGVPERDEQGHTPLEQEILEAVSEGEKSGLVDEDQREMIEAVVEFPSTTVDQIMTPRTEVQGIPVDSSLDDVKRFVASVGHSRVPVYEENLDRIVGLLYVKDLIPLLGNGGEPFVLRDHLREALFVPESKLLRDLLTQLKAAKVHIAIVLDEYGGTAGLVTFEDVLEEIVGDIRDEYESDEREEPTVTAIDERTFDVHARMRIDELNDEIDGDLPENEDYDTVGGFVFATLGRIPEAGDAFERNGLRFEITDAEKTRVNRLRITRELLAAAEAAESAD